MEEDWSVFFAGKDVCLSFTVGQLPPTGEEQDGIQFETFNCLTRAKGRVAGQFAVPTVPLLSRYLHLDVERTLVVVPSDYNVQKGCYR
jgi:hypothetical protein